MSKFEKSGINKGLKRRGYRSFFGTPDFSLCPGDEAADPGADRISGAFGTQTFDLVMTHLRPPITPETVDEYFPTLTLVEMKTTKEAVADQALNGFFFGATQREYTMAEHSALGTASRS